MNNLISKILVVLFLIGTIANLIVYSLVRYTDIFGFQITNENINNKHKIVDGFSYFFIIAAIIGMIYINLETFRIINIQLPKGTLLLEI